MRTVRYERLPKWKYRTLDIYVFETGIKGYDISTNFIKMQTNGVMVVNAGYCYDGASGPTRDTPNTFYGALGHDGLYQLMRMGLLPQKYRRTADRLLRKWLIEDGMYWFRAWIWYIFVSSPLGKNSAKVQKRVGDE